MYQIITLYTLNLHNITYQLYFNKPGKIDDININKLQTSSCFPIEPIKSNKKKWLTPPYKNTENSKMFTATKHMANQEKATIKIIGNFVALLFALAYYLIFTAKSSSGGGGSPVPNFSPQPKRSIADPICNILRWLSDV